MWGFEAAVIARYGRSRRGFTRVVTVFSVLGIMLGVAALIAVLAVMSGFREELMTRILGVSGHATLRAPAMTVEDAARVVQAVEKVGGVVAANPVVQGQVMVSSGGRSMGVLIRGVAGELPPYVQEKMHLQAEQTRIESGTLLVGHGLVRSLGILPGGGVTVLAPTGQRTIAGFVPSSRQMEVAGMFRFGMVQFDNGLVFGNMEDVQGLLRLGDRVQSVEVRVAEPRRIEALRPALEEAMALALPDTAPFELGVETWQESNVEFFRALQVERVTMFIILSLIVLVAAFNIITGQMMLVNDKLHDIAILRTMGATRRQVQRVFFLNGVMLGAVGVVAGSMLGMLIVWQMPAIVDGIKILFGVDLFPGDVYFLTELPARVNMTDMGMIVGMALGLAVLASWYPAWRAGRMAPVELLRGV